MRQSKFHSEFSHIEVSDQFYKLSYKNEQTKVSYENLHENNATLNNDGCYIINNRTKEVGH